MYTHIKADNRHFTDMGWLKTYWLFSFADYQDPANVRHGTLRVFNDDVVMPYSGFGTHSHSEMEIISIVLDGEMAHKDTMGHETVVKKGDVQRMTAGTGLQHSEKNETDQEVRFFQVWILPDKKHLPPSYDQYHFNEEQWHNKLLLLASDALETEGVILNSKGKIFRSSLSAGHSLSHRRAKNAKLFLYVIEGELTVNGRTIQRRDQLRMSNIDLLDISTQSSGDFLLIEVPSTLSTFPDEKNSNGGKR